MVWGGRSVHVTHKVRVTKAASKSQAGAESWRVGMCVDGFVRARDATGLRASLLTERAVRAKYTDTTGRGAQEGLVPPGRSFDDFVRQTALLSSLNFDPPAWKKGTDVIMTVTKGTMQTCERNC